MQSKPFKTFEEAQEAKKQYDAYEQVYARPNPNEEEGGYVVIYSNGRTSNRNRPSLLGCPHGR